MIAANLLGALTGEPGGPQLLALAQARDDVALVGGAVRDLMLGRRPRELDVVLADDGEAFARELASILGASVTTHGRFGTATVQWEGGRVDVAQRRGETYPAAGALPDVRPGTLAEDLARRDFTVNALAVTLGGPRAGELDAAEHALEDLDAARLRVLHEHSFEDDPTRLLRLARYHARLQFQPEPHTAALAAAALCDGALATVSGARLGAELRLALGEAAAPAALTALDQLGVLSALHPRLFFDGELAAAALELLAHADGGGGRVRPELLLLAVLAIAITNDPPSGAEVDAHALLDDLEFPAAERDSALRDASAAAALAGELADAQAPAQLYRAAASATPEGVALAGAWGATRSSRPAAATAAGEWLSKLQAIGLLISGEDLLAAGIPEGPEIGLRLHAALLAKLEGELDDGRAAELDAALKAQV